MKEENCGNCKFHKREANGNWICNNPQSAYYAFETEYTDSCEDYEEKE